jgi:hypothetical protein
VALPWRSELMGVGGNACKREEIDGNPWQRFRRCFYRGNFG